jgi:tRNA(Ile)-lysidine synthase
MNNTIYRKVRNFIEKYHMITEGDEVIVGLSGGADSVCLLHLLRRFQREVPYHLTAVHVNHGVRPEAAEDAAYAEQLCKELGVSFYLKEVDMKGYAAEHKLSQEEAGRILRYRAFEEVLLGQCEKKSADRTKNDSCVRNDRAGAAERRLGKIAVAHNSNDRAETMLFHLFRGSGMKGICSIQPVRESVIRPILCLTRDEIEAYLKENGLAYCVDATNEEDIYTRNKIRHHILPYAEEEICHGAVAHMCELADNLSETEDYLQEQTMRIYAKCVEEVGQGLRILGAELMKEHPVMVQRVLLLSLEKIIPHRKDVTARHITALQELLQKDGSREQALPCGVKAHLEYGTLTLTKESNPAPANKTDPQNSHVAAAGTLTTCPAYEIKPPMEVWIAGVGELVFTLFEPELTQSGQDFTCFQQNIPQNRYTKWFDYDRIKGTLRLRTRQQGDYLTIDSALATKSVKQYMINEKIPKSQRAGMYLLADDTHVMWIPGHRISEYYKVNAGTKHVLQVSIRGERNGRES